MPAAKAPATGNAPRWLPGEAAVAAGLALLVFAALAQHTLYSVDAHGFLIQAQRGDDGSKPPHLAYQPLLTWTTQLGARLGFPLHTAAVWLSAVGTALGLGAVHLANRRLGLDRASAAFATAATALAPAVLFFATVVEIHGQHFAFCGLAFLATIWCAERPTVWRGILLGLATTAGYLGHATGALLPALCVPLTLVLASKRGGTLRASSIALLVATATHGSLVVLLPQWLRPEPAPGATGSAAALFAMHLEGLWRSPTAILDSAWRDWLWPFAPWSMVLGWAACSRQSRALATASLLAVAVYVVATAALLVPFQDGIQVVGHGTERGAYVLPLAWPMGLCAALALRQTRWRWALLALSATVAIVAVRSHDTRPQQAFAAGFRVVAGDGPAFVLLGTHREVAAALLDLPDWQVDRDWQQLLHLFQLPADRLEMAWKVFDQWLRTKHQNGVSLWLTQGGMALLTEPGWTRGNPAGPYLVQQLRDAYAWEPAEAQGFSGWRLRPRP
jgi:hypothetical protein